MFCNSFVQEGTGSCCAFFFSLFSLCVFQACLTYILGTETHFSVLLIKHADTEAPSSTAAIVLDEGHQLHFAGLFQKSSLTELLRVRVPFLCLPSSEAFSPSASFPSRGKCESWARLFVSPRCLLGFQGSGSGLSEPVDDPRLSLSGQFPQQLIGCESGRGGSSLNLKGYGNKRPKGAGRMARFPKVDWSSV